jgi:hypothetical protein
LRKRMEVARSKAGVKAAAYSRVGDEAAVSFGTGDGGVLYCQDGGWHMAVAA